MKKFLLPAAMLIFGMVGSASATTYYEAYTGQQEVYSDTPDLLFAFDIDLANNGFTNSSLHFSDDATGFNWLNNEQLNSVGIAIDLFSTDLQPERFNLAVDIYWSNRDFTETVNFNATQNNSSYTYTYSFTQAQIDGWEEGGWGSVTINAANANWNDFRLDRVAMTASNSASAPVPEPATMLLMGIGLAGLVGYNRIRSNKKA